MAGRRTKAVTSEAAAELIVDGDTLAVGGLVGLSVPDELSKRFAETRDQRDLALMFAAGQGHGGTRGLNHLAREGLMRRAIGGHWGLVPAPGACVGGSDRGVLRTAGVVSRLFGEIAGGRPGLMTRVGLGTFVDPRLEGGRLNAVSTKEIVRVIELYGEESCYYPCRPIDVALLRRATADTDGNVTMEREAATLDSLSVAGRAMSAFPESASMASSSLATPPSHMQSDPASNCIAAWRAITLRTSGAVAPAGLMAIGARPCTRGCSLPRRPSAARAPIRGAKPCSPPSAACCGSTTTASS